MTNSIFYKKLMIYLFLLFSIFTILGTFTISLVLKSMVIYIRHSGWLASNEKLIAIIILIVLVFFSMLFAKWLTIWLTETHNSRSKQTFIVLTGILLCINLTYWIPYKEISFPVNIISYDKRFTGGAYPDEATLIKLKSQGYTTIVSLLDPLALPQEPFLINQEEETVAKLGLNLIRIPMLTGKVDTIEGNKRIETLAKSVANEKYYVHGFRDTERVALFIKLVNKYNPIPVTEKATSTISTTVENKLQPSTILRNYQTLNLDRGTAIQLDNRLMISPKPTLDEFKKYFIHTPNQYVSIPIRTVVSLNPDENIAQSSDIVSLLKSNKITYFNIPINLFPYDPDSVLKAVQKIKSLSDGVLVYSYYMPPQSTAISAFMISWLTNLPALPKNLFNSIPLQNGPVKVIAPNVAIGPRPDESEFGNYLAARGIREIGYIGTCNDNEAIADEKLAQSAGMKWTCLKTKSSIVINKLRTNGPWYVYGPELSLIENELSKRLHKVMPNMVIEGE